MKKEIEQYELIEQYLLGDLPENKYREVKQMIDSDADFAREVERHKDLFTVIDKASLIDIKSHIHRIHTQNKQGGQNKQIRNRIRYAIITGIILLSIASLILILRKEKKQLPQSRMSKPSSENIYKSASHDIATKESPYIITRENSNGVETETKTQTSQDNNNILLSSSVKQNKSQTDTFKKNTTPLLVISDIAEIKNTPEESSIRLPLIHNDSIDCSNVRISAKVTTDPSCEEKPTGCIRVAYSSFEGGIPPYFVSIDDKKNYYDDYIFENLMPSLYHVWVKDQNNCMTKLGTYRISSVSCSYEFVFAPDEGETWEIPTQGKTGDLKIYDQKRALVFQQEIEFPGEYTWDGRSDNGVSLPMGLYQFILELSNGEKKTGNVTIVR